MRFLDGLERTASMGQAAEELRITQSAATKVLQDVEQIFEAGLFNRSPRDPIENIGRADCGAKGKPINGVTRDKGLVLHKENQP
jgi:hypothetical protein